MYNGFSYPIELTSHSRKMYDAVRPAAEQLFDMEICALPYSAFRTYSETGSRVEYEKLYTVHRKMLCAFAAMALLGEQKRWLDKLCDICFAVCDEYTWALPAHIKNIDNASIVVTSIDLFASETSIALSEIYHIFSDVLPQAVKSRIEYELKRRIVEPYMASPRKFGISNWSAVCGCGVAAPFIYLGLDDEFAKIKQNILGNMDDFLASYNDDGCCLEGSLYWSYGFGFFCCFAELYRQYTNGKENLFLSEKVKRIAHFGQSAYLSDNYVVSFSDSGHTLGYDSGLWSLLSRHYDGINAPDEKYENNFGDDFRYRFAPFIRNLFAKDSGNRKNTTSEETVAFYKDAGWYVSKKHGFAFAAKCGNNNEPHNHNDVGSFLLFDNGRYIIDDPGWSQYSKEYFDKQKRYENPCSSSLGHSLPVIDGLGQLAGKEYRGSVVSHSNESFEIEFSAAYGNKMLDSLKRSFAIKPNGISFTDTAKGGFDSFTERLVSRSEPKICGGKVLLCDYAVSSSEKAEISFDSFTFKSRFCGFDGYENNTETVYIINFDYKDFSETTISVEKIG